MAMFPWEEAQAPLPTFSCEHCGKVGFISAGRLELCHCPAAERSRMEERERSANFEKSQAEMRPSFMDIRDKRKLRTGSGR